MRKLVTMATLGCSIILSASNALSASHVVDVTPANIEEQPLTLEVDGELHGDTAWFRIYIADGSATVSSCRHGSLQLGDTNDIRFSCNVEELEADENRLEYRLGVRRDVIDYAIFTFQNFDCEHPSFDGYRLRLVDFVEFD